MFDHISIQVRDFEKSKAFYEKALEPLGIKLLKEYEEGIAGFEIGEKTFWIGVGRGVTTGVHLAFTAENRKLVKSFYDAALAAGGRDNGKPGIREQYHPHYFGAFVFDPDGNNVEAVCHKPV